MEMTPFLSLLLYSVVLILIFTFVSKMIKSIFILFLVSTTVYYFLGDIETKQKIDKYSMMVINTGKTQITYSEKYIENKKNEIEKNLVDNITEKVKNSVKEYKE